MEALSWS